MSKIAQQQHSSNQTYTKWNLVPKELSENQIVTCHAHWTCNHCELTKSENNLKVIKKNGSIVILHVCKDGKKRQRKLDTVYTKAKCKQIPKCLGPCIESHSYYYYIVSKIPKGDYRLNYMDNKMKQELTGNTSPSSNEDQSPSANELQNTDIVKTSSNMDHQMLAIEDAINFNENYEDPMNDTLNLSLPSLENRFDMINQISNNNNNNNDNSNNNNNNNNESNTSDIDMNTKKIQKKSKKKLQKYKKTNKNQKQNQSKSPPLNISNITHKPNQSLLTTPPITQGSNLIIKHERHETRVQKQKIQMQQFRQTGKNLNKNFSAQMFKYDQMSLPLTHNKRKYVHYLNILI